MNKLCFCAVEGDVGSISDVAPYLVFNNNLIEVCFTYHKSHPLQARS